MGGMFFGWDQRTVSRIIHPWPPKNSSSRNSRRQPLILIFIVERERLFKSYRKGLTILAADQCPYAAKSAERIAEASRTLGLEPKLIRVGSAKASRELPTPYGVFSILYDGKLIAHRPISATRFMSIMGRNAEQRGTIRSALKPPNQSPEPTTTAVTPPAAQEPRQP